MNKNIVCAQKENEKEEEKGKGEEVRTRSGRNEEKKNDDRT